MSKCSIPMDLVTKDWNWPAYIIFLDGEVAILSKVQDASCFPPLKALAKWHAWCQDLDALDPRSIPLVLLRDISQDLQDKYNLKMHGMKDRKGRIGKGSQIVLF